MIFDCFLYNGEREMLDLRVDYLRGVMDMHVIVQSCETFAGMPREIADVPTGCMSIIAQPMPDGYTFPVAGATAEGGERWMREAWQRNICIPIRPQLGDYVLMGDVDEIPNRDDVAARRDGVYVMDMLRYYVNVTTGEAWAGTVGFTYDGRTMQPMQTLRNDRYGMPRAGGGWHFSYCGQDLHTKLRSFSHAEFDTPEFHAQIQANRAALVDPFGRDAQRFNVVAAPEWVDAARFGGLIYQ